MNKSLQVLAHEAKTLRKLANREGQGALKSYYEKQAAKAEFTLRRSIANNSAYATPRSSGSKLPKLKYEPLE